MHSAAIFLGVLLFGWGMHGLKVALFIIRIPDENDGPFESFLDRWAPHLLAIIMLPLPIAFAFGGGALVRWGFLSG